MLSYFPKKYGVSKAFLRKNNFSPEKFYQNSNATLFFILKNKQYVAFGFRRKFHCAELFSKKYGVIKALLRKNNFSLEKFYQNSNATLFFNYKIKQYVAFGFQ